MKVCWTETAESHLDGIYEYIAKNSPTYALRMVDRLIKRSQQIADFPLSGRRVPEYNLEQLREVLEGSYRIIYHIKSDQIDIVAVLHGAKEIFRSNADEERPE